MTNDRRTPKRERDSIYRLILGLMIFDMLAGAVLIVIGLVVMPAPELVVLGVGLTAIGGGLFLFFRRLARRGAG